MAALRGSASYKKKDGTLVLAKDATYLSWTPKVPPGSKPEVTLVIPSITNLQQTPPDKVKVMLKIFAQSARDMEPVVYLFTFTSPTKARVEADSLRDALSKAIQALKVGGSTLAAPGGASSSGSIAIASAVTSKPVDTNESWYDDERLRTDYQLQQSLFKANQALSKTFMESMRTKPESMSSSQFSSQFWSSRLGLLRAHAIEKSQSKGAYNVLSTIKSRTEDNALKLNITREQINLIFSQHPLIKRVYDENVPKLSEEAFWSRFFQSRLHKKLKGDRITEADQKDAILDKYLSDDDDAERERRLMAAHIPKTIDIAGNEENHSQRLGNAPDLWMRPTSADRVPVIRTLNSLSEKIMSHVAPNDIDPSLPIGMDEETFNELALRDLQGDAVENRIILNVKDQSRFFSSGKEVESNGNVFRFDVLDPKEAARVLHAETTALSQGLDLSTAIGIDDDSDSDDSEDGSAPKESSHVGSRTSLRQASAQIFAAIAQQRAQAEDLSTDFSTSGLTAVTATASTAFLSPTIFDRLLLTHATTTEFLSHFWATFLSGDPSRADEVRKLVETFDRAMDRIKAVSSDAEQERLKDVDKAKQQVREYYERTRKKLPFNQEDIKGGEKAVRLLMAPTIEAIAFATRKYAEALARADASGL